MSYVYDPNASPGPPVPGGVAPPVEYQQFTAVQASPYPQTYQPPPNVYAQPPPTYVPPYYPPAPNPDEVRTIFVTGFPDDVKERELNNLLRFLPGYEASQLHFRNGQAQGFALFAHGGSARAAVDAIHNLVFDDNVVLRAEMAHKNMYLKDDGSSKRSRPTYDTSRGGYGGAPPAAAYGPPGAAPSYTFAAAMPAAVVPPTQPRGYVQVTNTKDNPPCNTLFIGNLSDTVNETELRGLFCHQPGFRQLKLVRGPKGVSCFIEFADIPAASAVHASQQGAILQSSDRGGIRIQFSKNPFGRKRDAYGNYVAEFEQPAGSQVAAGAAGGTASVQSEAQTAVQQ